MRVVLELKRYDTGVMTSVGSMDHLRPHISEIGAHKRGPKANPRLLVPWSVKRQQDNSVGCKDFDCNVDFGSARSNKSKLLTRVMKQIARRPPC